VYRVVEAGPRFVMPYRHPAPIEHRSAFISPRIARSLAEAQPTDVIWLDRDGNVRPMSRLQRYRLVIAAGALSVGMVAACALAFAAVGFRVVGILLGALYLLFGAAAYWGMVARRALRQLATGHTVSADRAADRLLMHPIGAAGFQRLARLIKARVAQRAGRHTDAVEQYRAIRYAHSPQARRTVTLNRVTEIATYEEIIALCNAKRTDDARELLSNAPKPTGDYLDLLYDTARLMVAFTADDPGVVPDKDVERMMRYDRLSGGWGVLALVGWHAHKRGNENRSRRAVDAELSKPRTELATRLPAVALWLDQFIPGI
jgi:hypothetical protein